MGIYDDQIGSMAARVRIISIFRPIVLMLFYDFLEEIIKQKKNRSPQGHWEERTSNIFLICHITMFYVDLHCFRMAALHVNIDY